MIIDKNIGLENTFTQYNTKQFQYCVQFKKMLNM